MRLVRASVFSLAVLLALVPTAGAQSVTGQISGTVTDASGAVVVGATFQLTHDLSKQVRDLTTENSGAFVFTGLAPAGTNFASATFQFSSNEENSL